MDNPVADRAAPWWKAAELLRELPAAIYATDAAGLITFYNEAAAKLWGMRPELGKSTFCGSWKLYRPDGTRLPHDHCPTALALKSKRAVCGMEAMTERPDGTRVPFMSYPKPLFDASGALVGTINLLVEISGRHDSAAQEAQAEIERHRADQSVQRLAAIVESSDDAILTKDFNGIITSWNRGAQRLFGYTEEEVIGKPVTILIPPERHDEEPGILARIRRGESVDHYETIRRRKDGSLIEISLTVSPLRNLNGDVIGASKVARDITERKRAQQEQQLLLREMDHRIKNLFAVAGSLVTLSARTAETPKELAFAVRERLGALARAHDLTVPKTSRSAVSPGRSTTLHEVIHTVLSPFQGRIVGGRQRVEVRGIDTRIDSSAVTSLALLLHEFATNAAKYGALSASEGYIEIDCSEQGGRFMLVWVERGGPPVTPSDTEGFGSLLGRTTAKGQLGAELSREWYPEGLTIRLCVPCDRLRPAADAVSA
jgi:PAS domain S-box-containing protein